MTRSIIIACILLIFNGFLEGQQQKPASPAPEDPPQGKAPVLIRDEVDKPKPPVVRDPAKADEEIKIGDFYFKRENYKAALARYQEALLNRPDYPPAQRKLILTYDKLIQTLEKHKDQENARKYMQEFVEKFPTEKKAAEYSRLLGQSSQK